MLKLAGLSNVLTRAAAVVELETRMAKAHLGREESGDVQKGNNHWTRADFSTKAPGLDWEAFFATAGLKQPEVFVVGSRAPSRAFGPDRPSPLDTWKDYLTFHAMEHWARVSPRPWPTSPSPSTARC